MCGFVLHQIAGGFGWGMERIDGDDDIGDVERIEPICDRGNLVGFDVDRDLTADLTRTMPQPGEEMHRPLA